MFLLDLLGSAAIVAGGGYVAVLGTMDAARRVKGVVRQQIKREVVEAQTNSHTSLGAKIADMIRTRPNEWEAQNCTIVHKPTGLEVWIATGVEYVGIWRVASGADPISGDGKGRFFSRAEKKLILSAYNNYIETFENKKARLQNAELHSMLDKHLNGEQAA